jgi:tetratricopeptide (TPR) repeat protein
VLIGLLVIALAAPAHAQSAQPAGAQADALFRRGREQMKKGNLSEACSAFEQSQRLDPRITTLLNCAGCLEKIGRLAAAHALFLQVERQTEPASDDEMAQLHKIAAGRAAKLLPRLSKLTIRVSVEHAPERLEILRDGAPIARELWNRPVPIDGGTYTIVARAPDVEEMSAQLTIATEADAKIVDVPVLRSISQRPPRGSASSARVPGRLGRLGLPIAMGAGAVVLLGGALGLSLWGDSTYARAQVEVTSQAKRDSLEASANWKRHAAGAIAIGGIGCTGLATWIFIRRRGGRGEPTGARTGLTLAPIPSGVAVAGQF